MPELTVAAAVAARGGVGWGSCAEEGPRCECGGVTGRD